MDELLWPPPSTRTRTRLQLEWLSRQVWTKRFPSALLVEPPTVNESVAAVAAAEESSRRQPPWWGPPLPPPPTHSPSRSAQAVIISSNARAEQKQYKELQWLSQHIATTRNLKQHQVLVFFFFLLCCVSAAVKKENIQRNVFVFCRDPGHRERPAQVVMMLFYRSVDTVLKNLYEKRPPKKLRL